MGLQEKLDDNLRNHLGAGVCSGTVLGIGTLRANGLLPDQPSHGVHSSTKASPRKRIFVSAEVLEMINNAAQELNALQSIIEQDAEDSGRAIPKDFQPLDPLGQGDSTSPGRRPGSKSRSRWGTFSLMTQLCKRNPHAPQLGSLDIPDDEEAPDELSPEGAVALGLHGPHGGPDSPDKVKFDENESSSATPKVKRAAWQTALRKPPAPVVQAPPPVDPAAGTELETPIDASVDAADAIAGSHISPKSSVVPKLDLPHKKMIKNNSVPKDGQDEQDAQGDAEEEEEEVGLSPGTAGMSTISAGREYKQESVLSESARRAAEEQAELARRAALAEQLESMHRHNLEEKTRVRIMLDDDDDDDDEPDQDLDSKQGQGAKMKRAGTRTRQVKESSKAGTKGGKGSRGSSNKEADEDSELDAMQKRRALLNIRASESGSEDEGGTTSRRVSMAGQRQRSLNGRLSRSTSGIGGRARKSESGEKAGSTSGARTTQSGASRLGRVSMTGSVGSASGRVRQSVAGMSRLNQASRISTNGRRSMAGSVSFKQDADVSSDDEIAREVRLLDNQPSFRSRPRSQSSPGMGQLGGADPFHILDGEPLVSRRSEGGTLISADPVHYDDGRKWRPVGGPRVLVADPIYTWTPQEPAPARPSSAGWQRPVNMPEWRAGGSLGMFMPLRFESACGAVQPAEQQPTRCKSATTSPDWNSRPSWRPGGIVWTDPYAHLRWMPPSALEPGSPGKQHPHGREVSLQQWVPAGAAGEFGPRHFSWEAGEAQPAAKHTKEARVEPWKNPGSEYKPLAGGTLDWGPYQPPAANPFARSDEPVPVPEASRHVGPAAITVKPPDRTPADVFYRRHYMPLVESSVYEEVEEVTLMGTQQHDAGTNKQMLHAAVVTYKNKIDDNVVGRAMRLMWEPAAAGLGPRPTTSHYLEVPIPVAGGASPPGGWLCPSNTSSLAQLDSSASLKAAQRCASRCRTRTRARPAPRLVVLPRPGHPSLLMAVQAKNRRHARAAATYKFDRNRQMKAVHRALTPLGLALAAAMDEAGDHSADMPSDAALGPQHATVSVDQEAVSVLSQQAGTEDVLPALPPKVELISFRTKQMLERTPEIQQLLPGPPQAADASESLVDAVLARAAVHQSMRRHSDSHFKTSLTEAPGGSVRAWNPIKLRGKTSLPAISATFQHQTQTSLKNHLNDVLLPDPSPPLSLAPLLPPVARDADLSPGQASAARAPPACMPLHLLPTPFMGDRAKQRLERQLQTGPLLPRMLALATAPELLQSFPKPWEHTFASDNVSQNSNVSDQMVSYLTAALGTPDLKAQSLRMLQPHGLSKSIGKLSPSGPSTHRPYLSARQMAEQAMSLSEQPPPPVSSFRQQDNVQLGRKGSPTGLASKEVATDGKTQHVLDTAGGISPWGADTHDEPMRSNRSPFGMAWLPMSQRKLHAT